MTNTLRYHEVRSPQSWNPLDAAMRLCHAAPFHDFVLYEKDGVWYYAGGSAAQILVNSREVIVSWPGKNACIGWADNPLPIVSGLLHECPAEGWSASGWAAFELSYALHGLPSPESGLPLMRLDIPHTEAIISPAGAVIKSVSRPVAAQCLELLEGSGDRAPRDPVQIPTAGGRADYCATVEAAITDIRGGQFEKVILSRRVPVSQPVDMAATYRVGREANTPARSFLLRRDGMEAAGFCPEIVAKVDRAGRVITQPLAGTRAYGRDPEIDRALSAELCSDPKEVYEHAISMRSSWLELGTVCAPGSVRVDEPMALRFRGTVQHLASVVSGQLAAGRTPLDALGSVFPAVTASGIPKPEACSCISRLEPAARGLYAGSVFRLDSSGDLDAALVLRSVFQAGGSAWLQAGAGIVSASRPEREFEETREKLASVARHIVPAADTEGRASLAAPGALAAPGGRTLAATAPAPGADRR